MRATLFFLVLLVSTVAFAQTEIPGSDAAHYTGSGPPTTVPCSSVGKDRYTDLSTDPVTLYVCRTAGDPGTYGVAGGGPGGGATGTGTGGEHVTATGSGTDGVVLRWDENGDVVDGDSDDVPHTVADAALWETIPTTAKEAFDALASRYGVWPAEVSAGLTVVAGRTIRFDFGSSVGASGYLIVKPASGFDELDVRGVAVTGGVDGDVVLVRTQGFVNYTGAIDPSCSVANTFFYWATTLDTVSCDADDSTFRIPGGYYMGGSSLWLDYESLSLSSSIYREGTSVRWSGGLGTVEGHFAGLDVALDSSLMSADDGDPTAVVGDLVFCGARSGGTAICVRAEADDPATTPPHGVITRESGGRFIVARSWTLTGVDTSGCAAPGSPIYLSNTIGDVSCAPGDEEHEVGYALDVAVSGAVRVEIGASQTSPGTVGLWEEDSGWQRPIARTVPVAMGTTANPASAEYRFPLDGPPFSVRGWDGPVTLPVWEKVRFSIDDTMEPETNLCVDVFAASRTLVDPTTDTDRSKSLLTLQPTNDLVFGNFTFDVLATPTDLDEGEFFELVVVGCPADVDDVVADCVEIASLAGPTDDTLALGSTWTGDLSAIPNVAQGTYAAIAFCFLAADQFDGDEINSSCVDVDDPVDCCTGAATGTCVDTSLVLNGFVEVLN